MTGPAPEPKPSAEAATLLAAVARRCAARGWRLTPVRRWVLERLVAAARPVTAYELIAARAEATGQRIGPPTIYRALEFLEAVGAVARLSTRHAFIAAPEGVGAEAETAFFVCAACGSAEEVSDPRLGELLLAHAGELGFEPVHPVLEVKGRCRACHAAPP